MTGRRPARGPADHPWRGGRAGGSADAADTDGSKDLGDPRSGAEHGAELEELSLRPVARRGGSGPSIAGAMAVLALAALLAGGLGVLGGRQEPSSSAPPSSAVVGGPPASAARTARPSPAITPYTDCGPDPAEPPLISLQTNGVPTPGLVEVVDRGAGATPTAVAPTPADPLGLPRGPYVEVRPDVITEVWIDGAACALRWFIALDDPLSEQSFEIEQAGMADQMDPRVAAQNRFNLSHALARHRALGNDIQLVGAFQFRDIAVVAWWRVAIQALDLPTPILRDGRTGEEIELVSGCHLRLRLANGYEEDMQACGTDLSEEIGGAAPVVPGAKLWLEFDGLPGEDLTLVCGRLSGRDFVAEPAPGCREDVPDGGAITVPDVQGDWTIAMSTCGEVGATSASYVNTLCGTWYANVEVVEATRVE